MVHVVASNTQLLILSFSGAVSSCLCLLMFWLMLVLILIFVPFSSERLLLVRKPKSTILDEENLPEIYYCC